MQARTVDASRGATPDDARTPAPGRVGRRAKAGGWLRGATAGADERDGASHVEQLEAELALLREENARLKIRAAREPERPWDERVRDRVVPRATHSDGPGDDVWELVTECRLLRTALVDACRDLEVALQRVDGCLPAS
ncbi:hypothetical protein [Conexibacter sp. CPCC 206217]|uniref:hypothetical protein n=1 Tax=Conexibacter sp. CPCC 206217 TaxID=3064574 RepID=UPI0027276EF3|nr:hypothetical protein [Conexibacter sp. CPCC 206217]MDO8212481.1 hypothetical protein [Conexibacter sp. CPCC 206217]